MIDPPDPDEDNVRQQAPLSWLEGDMPYSEEFGDFYYSKADGRFHSFELRLLGRDDIGRALAAWPDLSGKALELTARWPDQPAGDVHIDFECGENLISLHIHSGLALEKLTAATFAADAWFLDGFSPARNPDMWSADLMRAVADHTREGGTFATYSAAGWVRRNLQAAGFKVEKRAGHTGKRDMSAGILAGSASDTVDTAQSIQT